MSVVKVENLSAYYRKNKVLYDVNFNVQPGFLTGIIGPNGAGKSTLLKVMLKSTDQPIIRGAATAGVPSTSTCPKR
jgi:ABC-type Mn2+/Zn2+ transport system ATPase subunit